MSDGEEGQMKIAQKGKFSIPETFTLSLFESEKLSANVHCCCSFDSEKWIAQIVFFAPNKIKSS